jgi:UDP-GlcNAc:undecaprenyl-phosphate GlcNAc-1-phosphate transferase
MQNVLLYLQPFLLAFGLSFLFMEVLIALGRKGSRSDAADGRQRGRNISRLGGLGIIAAFWLAVYLTHSLVFDSLKLGMAVCSFLIATFGVWDDRKELSWKKQLLFQFFIAVLMLAAGLQVDYIANPSGGREFRLDTVIFQGLPLLGSLFVLLWIVGFMNVANWLDGLDGLAGGVGMIASFTLFCLAIGQLVNQPPLGILAIALCGALLGFLCFNRPPARIFMGTSGAYFLGFLLGLLAIFAGGKIATAVLVMGLPILDAFWVMVKRLREGRSPFAGDRSHLQHNLLERGWPPERIVLFFCLLSSVFGLVALLFQGMGKLFFLFILGSVVSLLIVRVKFHLAGTRNIRTESLSKPR